MSELDELERLAALRERGQLTEEEFQALKAKVMQPDVPQADTFRAVGATPDEHVGPVQAGAAHADQLKGNDKRTTQTVLVVAAFVIAFIWLLTANGGGTAAPAPATQTTQQSTVWLPAQEKVTIDFMLSNGTSRTTAVCALKLLEQTYPNPQDFTSTSTQQKRIDFASAVGACVATGSR